MQIMGKNGYSSGFSACYFGLRQIGSEENGYALLFTVAPYYTTIAWGYLMIILAFATVVKRAGIRAALQQGRLATFALVYGTCLMFSLLVPAQLVTGKQPSNEAEYYTCLVRNWITSLFPNHSKVMISIYALLELPSYMIPSRVSVISILMRLSTLHILPFCFVCISLADTLILSVGALRCRVCAI